MRCLLTERKKSRGRSRCSSCSQPADDVVSVGHLSDVTQLALSFSLISLCRPSLLLCTLVGCTCLFANYREACSTISAYSHIIFRVYKLCGLLLQTPRVFISSLDRLMDPAITATSRRSLSELLTCPSSSAFASSLLSNMTRNSCRSEGIVKRDLGKHTGFPFPSNACNSALQLIRLQRMNLKVVLRS